LSNISANAGISHSNSGVNIRVEDVYVSTGTTVILRDIRLEIKQGEFVAILGKSGAGKSTLLRTMAGLLKPAKGSLLLNDQDFHSLTHGEKLVLRRKIGYIPQQFKLIKETSVFENVMVGRLGYLGALNSALRLYPSADVEIVVKCINKVGLGGRENNRVKRLSGGEQQRVAIARCLAQEPVVILADEPIASLDVVLAENILDSLTSANKGGATVICVLHNIETALKYARRIILLNKGDMVTDTVPEKINEYAIKKLLAD
jgi:phosphonate transport system ATP-binding protein